MSSHSVGFRLQRCVQTLSAGINSRPTAQRGRDVHRRGKCIVRTLAHVHVVVRMDRAFFSLGTKPKAQLFVRQVGNHLVGVHVGRRAGAGLVDVDGKLGVMLALGHFAGRCQDGVGSLGVELVELAIGLRRPISNSRTRELRPLAPVRGRWENSRPPALSKRRTAHRPALAFRPSCRVRCGIWSSFESSVARPQRPVASGARRELLAGNEAGG